MSAGERGINGSHLLIIRLEPKEAGLVPVLEGLRLGNKESLKLLLIGTDAVIAAVIGQKAKVDDGPPDRVTDGASGRKRNGIIGAIMLIPRRSSLTPVIEVGRRALFRENVDGTRIIDVDLIGVAFLDILPDEFSDLTTAEASVVLSLIFFIALASIK